MGALRYNLNKGNEETYAEKENLQHNGNHSTGGSDWLTCSIILAVLARRKENILTENWYMIAINGTHMPGK
jgi:hypothetical protein